MVIMNTGMFLVIIVGNNIKGMYTKIKNYYNWGERFLTNEFHIETRKIANQEKCKLPLRSDVINFLLSQFQERETNYLEIGVRNPKINFDHIVAGKKTSVDPGIEFKENPVDFKITSDEFFEGIKSGEILSTDVKFDVIFIDGLHLANQVDRDIINSLEYLKPDGFIVLHDCNPPTEWHAREENQYKISPAMYDWNGTTWKSFYKARKNNNLFSCCIDSDWGIGVISKSKNIGDTTKIENEFYEYKILEANRTESLNLVQFETFKKMFY